MIANIPSSFLCLLQKWCILLNIKPCDKPVDEKVYLDPLQTKKQWLEIFNSLRTPQEIYNTLKNVDLM